ncbi:MAG: EamA family transporter [Bacteroidales bacterium]|nr:EamA family transporter [Bacteroidales bacterium]
MNNKVKGYLFAAISAATYGMNPLFALPLYEGGMDLYSVLFFRYLFAIPILAIMLKIRRRDFSIDKKDISPLIILGVLFALSSITLFSSYHHMDAGIASTILFVYPIMVALIMFLFFKEKISAKTIACIAVALVGIALLCKSGEGAVVSMKGVLFVLGSALSYSIYIVFVNKSRIKKMATIKVTMYVLTVGWIIFAAKALIDGRLTTPSPEEWYLWFCVIALSIFPTIISLICTTEAIQYIGSTPTAILGVLEPVTAVFFGVVIFGEVLTTRIVIGLILVITSVTFVVAGGNIGKILLRLRKMFPAKRR